MKHSILFRKWIYYLFLIIGAGMPGYSSAQSSVTITGPDTVCVGDVPTYILSPVNSNLTYTWTVTPAAQGTVYYPNATTTMIQWNTAGTATVKVQGKDTAGNVIAEDSISVIVDSALHPVIIASSIVNCMPLDTPSHADPPSLNDTSNCTKVCAYSIDTYTVAAVTGASYSWQVTGAGSYSATANTCVVQWGAAGSGNVSVTETRGTCSATATMCIQIIAGPVALFTTLPNTPTQAHIQICLNSTVNFIDQSIPPPGSPIVSWLWDFGDGSYTTAGANVSGPVSHTYTHPGLFHATLTVTDACGCSNSFFIFVEVSHDSSDVKIECPRVSCEGEPLTYYLADTPSCNPLGSWIAQGGTIVSQTPFQVQVIWNNVDSSGFGYLSYYLPCGPCPGTTTVKVPVMQQQGTIQGPTSVCPNRQYVYSLPQWPTSEFTWYVSGNGTLSGTNQPNKVVVTSGSSGSFTVGAKYCNTLINCTGSATLTATVMPPATINGQTTVCLNTTNTYTLGGATTATWTLTAPNNTTTTYTNVSSISPTFTQAGGYMLSIDGNFCAPDPMIIQVKNPPSAPTAIQGPDSACTGVPVQYTAQVPLSGTVFQWYTNNGSVNAAAGASTYATFSSLPAQLKVVRVSTGPAHCVSDTFTKIIQNVMPPIMLSDNIPQSDHDTVCGSSQWNFYTNYAGADVYQWQILSPSMGSVVSGGTTHSVQILFNNPVGAGNNVFIVVTESKCNNVQSDTLLVHVRGIPQFTASSDSDSVCAGDGVVFTITPNPTNYNSVNWEFGDGGTSNTLNPTHVYPNNPTIAVYHPSVTINEPYGCPTSVTVQAGTVAVKPAPVAFVSVESTTGSGCGGFTAWLAATVTTGYGQTSNYQWSGPTTNPAAPDCDTCMHWDVNQYGSYHVTVTNTNGCSSNSNVVAFQESCDSCPGPKPVLNTSSDTMIGCGTDSLRLTYSSNGVTIVSQGWVAPIGATITSSTTGFTATATAVFSVAGIYNVGYEVNYINQSGDTCKVTFGIQVKIPYMGGLLYDVICGTGSDYQITLHDHSDIFPDQVGHILHSYYYQLQGASSWTPSVGQNTAATSYSFQLGAGTYNIREVITSNLPPASYDPPCTTEIDGIVLPAKPDASFYDSSGILPPHYPCERDVAVHFHNTSTPATGLSYLWNFGDNTTNYQENPAKVYEDGDTMVGYIVTLAVKNSMGCTDTAYDTVKIAPDPYWGYSTSTMPTLSAAPAPPQCHGTLITLQYEHPSGYPNLPPYYTWYYFNTPLTSATPGLSSFSVGQSGGYRVIGTDLNGCRVPSVFDTVPFIQVPPAVISGQPDACKEETFTLNGYAGNISGLTYQWVRNPGNVNVGATSSVSQTLPVGTYTYTLTLGLNGCTASSVPFTVTVHALPPNPGTSFTVTGCNPYTVKLTATNSQQGTYNWSSGGSGASTFVHEGGAYRVIFTDQYGCTSSDSIHVPYSPQAFMWIFPTGCFCIKEVQGPRCRKDHAYITGPIIQFPYWAYLFNGNVDVSGSGYVPDYDDFLSPLGPGTYNLVLNNGYCSDTSGNMYYEGKYCKTLGERPANLEEQNKAQLPELKLIPNPTTGQTLAEYRLKELGQGSEIEVYDALGRKIGSYPLNSQQGSILLPMERFASGMYQVLLIRDGKVIKESKLSKTD